MKIPEPITRAAHKLAFKTRKYSPEILTVTGVGLIVGGVVVACRQSYLYADAILEDHEYELGRIEATKEAVEVDADLVIEYTDRQIAIDTVRVNAKTAWEFTKIYAPAVMLVAGGVGCLLGAQGILKKRNAAITAAYNAVNAAFESYRGRVRKELGDEVDEHFMNGTPAEIRDPKTGKTVLKLDTGDQGIPSVSPYARFFDSSSPRWVKDPEYNLTFLNAQQRFANQKLRADGFLFLNDVYDALGIPRTQAGQVVGWIWHNDGRDFVDFGIYNMASEKARDFVNGYENIIRLDFNVDGYIVDQI